MPLPPRLYAAAVVAACTTLASAPTLAADTAKDPVITAYADMALAKYTDALRTAEALEQAIDALIAAPSDGTLQAARAAWLAARVPYQQTEPYRFGNAIVDEWEGKVNAWPLDEGLIDYVDQDFAAAGGENELFTANVIANTTLKINGADVDATAITPALLSQTLHEAGGIEANVATGYHAIEFLLWGQDLNGTGPGAGNRPATDFSQTACTGGNCARRIAYLKAATDLLLADLKDMVAAWGADGAARKALADAGPDGALRMIMTGLGSLSYGELAGERMKLGLLIHDPEEEHDCFADNTHNSHYYNIIGMRNIYLGQYSRTDGSVVTGPSVSDLVRAKSPEADAELRAALEATYRAAAKMKARAETVEAYDQMIGEGNVEGNAIVQAVIDALLVQTKAIERAVAALDLQPITFEGSDSLDNPAAVTAQ